MIPSVSLHNLGKKFNKEWIFRGIDYTISPGQKLLISGGNGSGKSTLLQVISGFVSPNEGHVAFSFSGQSIQDATDLKDHISFASPYLQLIEDLTLEEMIAHAKLFKPFLNGLDVAELIRLIDLQHARHKFIRQFSSGMKQRLKLGLAILADTPVLLLDEPVSNLDRSAIAWYRSLISTHTQERTVIVCSNAIEDEHFFCDTALNIMDYKPAGK